MNLPDIYLSVPSARPLGRAMGNDETMARVAANFRGTPREWTRLERRILSLLRICGTQTRYLEEVAPTPLAGHAARRGVEALAEAGVAAEALDVVYYGSIAREYFEPATAAEIAALLGARRALPVDVTSACAGSLLAVHAFCGLAAVDDRVRHGLVCTSTLTAGHLSYDLQTPEDVDTLGAGLTLGNAASALVLSRTPHGRCGRIRAMLGEGMPEHHDLCRAPVDGPFHSRGAELFALSRFVPAHLGRLVDRAGWDPLEVDLYVCHQPSNHVVTGVVRALGLRPERVPPLHAVYGNCAASSVPLALRHLADEGRLEPGMKVVLCTAASGFVMASVALEWHR